MPRTVSLEKAQTGQLLKIFAGKEAPAAAIKKNENVKHMIFHDFRQWSVGKQAPADAITRIKKRQSMNRHYF